MAVSLHADVLIVGAGPGGTAAATVLGRSGARVVLPTVAHFRLAPRARDIAERRPPPDRLDRGASVGARIDGGRPWLANLLVWRAERRRSVREQVERLLQERTDPDELFSLGGMLSALVR